MEARPELLAHVHGCCGYGRFPSRWGIALADGEMKLSDETTGPSATLAVVSVVVVVVVVGAQPPNQASSTASKARWDEVIPCWVAERGRR